MGGGAWSDLTSQRTSTTRSTQTRAQVFQNTTIDPGMKLDAMTIRESRDSAEHPNSHAIIVAFDETGSMGEIPEYFAKTALGALMRELLSKQPVPDPQLLVCGVGDSTGDASPFQPGQFESDNRVDEWLTKIHLEGNGQGGGHESYGLVHHFAGTRTSIDCFEKRQEKGMLFTIGDEKPHPIMYASEIKSVFGETEASDLTIEAAIASAQRLYDVFHIVVKSQSYSPEMSLPTWKKLLPERVLRLDDYQALPELIMTTIGRIRGMSLAAATAGFSAKTTEMVLASGVQHLQPSAGASGGVARI